MLSNGFPTLVERVRMGRLCPVAAIGFTCCLILLLTWDLPAKSLQKGPVYFYDRYGSQKSSKAVVGYNMYTPFKHIMVPIEQPCLIRQYRKEGIALDVLLSDPGLEALWVRITLKEKFTDESLEAALLAYGSEWKRLTSDSSLDLEIPLIRTMRVFQSSEGRIAYFSPVVKQVMIYSTDAVAAAKAFERSREKSRTAVPVF